MSKAFDREQGDAMTERLRAIAQPQRLMILATLLDGECAVGEIEAATAISQPALSQQLGELRRAGLVATRREARQIYYRFANADAEERVRSLFAAFGAIRPVSRPKAKRDHQPSGSAFPAAAAMFARIG